MATLWVLTGGIALLQMYHVRLGVLTAQGADIVAPALLYFVSRQGKSLIRLAGVEHDKPVKIAVTLFVLCVVWEWCQRFDVIPGVFDWFDLLAYLGGVLGAFWLDRMFFSAQLSLTAGQWSSPR